MFVLLTVGIGIGAVNTGNNLLYMLLGSMLAFIVLSGVLAEISLRGLEVWRRLPTRLHAGRETSIAIGVRNAKRGLPSFNLAVRETFGPKRNLDSVRFVHLEPESESEDVYRCVFPRRGRCRFRGWIVETTFPFGLFVKSRTLTGADSAIVFPRTDLEVSIPPGVVARGVEGAWQRGFGEEFEELRDYRYGDDRRQISWKASARRRALVVRETAGGASARVELVIPNVGVGEGRDALFEHAIDHAASLAREMFQAGYAVGLRSLDESLPPHVGGDHELALLTRLALMRQLTPDDIEGLSIVGREDAAQVVVCTPTTKRYLGSIPAEAEIQVRAPALEAA